VVLIVVAPLRAITSMTSEKRLPSIKQWSIWLKVCLSGKCQVWRWIRLCLKYDKSRQVWGHFHLYSHAGCACLSLADVRFPGQLLRLRLPSPTSRHDLGRLRMPAPAAHKINPWPPFLSHLLVNLCWWESSWKICLLFWLRRDARWLVL
jgi:hypothetical protein